MLQIYKSDTVDYKKQDPNSTDNSCSGAKNANKDTPSYLIYLNFQAQRECIFQIQKKKPASINNLVPYQLKKPSREKKEHLFHNF